MKFKNGRLDEFVDIIDTDGNVLNASDGGIIKVGERYYWYGQALRDRPEGYKGQGGQVTDVGVVMYSSADLSEWKYEGVVLACSEGELRAPMRFERPKIIYNEKTDKYVLWCHYVGYPGDHSFDIGGGEIGVAVSDSINGEYKWLGHFRPIDDDGVVRDCTLYKDEDGSAYLFFDRDISLLERSNRCIYVVKLSDDYLSCTDEYKRIDPAYRREAAAVLHHGDYYYMITSGMSGWSFNRACYYRSRDLMGEWEDMGDPCVGDDQGTTFNSQTSFVFSTDDGRFIHVSERHNTSSFLHCSYIWLPVEFGDRNTLSLRYAEDVEI